LDDEVTILPSEPENDTAAAQQYDGSDSNDESGVRFPRFFGGRDDRWCFHVFLQIMTE